MKAFVQKNFNYFVFLILLTLLIFLKILNPAFIKSVSYLSFDLYQKVFVQKKESDVVIFSTSSKNTLLTKSDLTNITLKRDKKLLLVDLSVPRNLSSDLYDLDNIEIINVDNLKDAVNENYKKRKGEIIKAELYIEEFLVEFDDWTNSRLLRPSMVAVSKRFHLFPEGLPTTQGSGTWADASYRRNLFHLDYAPDEYFSLPWRAWP